MVRLGELGGAAGRKQSKRSYRRSRKPAAWALVDDAIDRLDRVCALFPAAGPDGPILPGVPVRDSSVLSSAWGAELVGGAADAAGKFGRALGAMRDLDERTAAVVQAALEAGREDRLRAELLRDQIAAAAEAVLPLAQSSWGLRLLVSVLDEKRTAMGDLLAASQQANAAAASRLHELALGYREYCV